MATGADAQIAAERLVDAEQIARDAAAFVWGRFGEPGEVRAKGERDARGRVMDLVTEVDVACEAQIREDNPKPTTGMDTSTVD